MEEGNLNFPVNNESDSQSQSNRKTATELNEKLSQIIADSQQAQPASDEKTNIVQLHKVPVQQDSNRSSVGRIISLVNCRCSCHREVTNPDGAVRYELIETDETEPDSKIEKEASALSGQSLIAQSVSSAISERLAVETSFASKASEHLAVAVESKVSHVSEAQNDPPIREPSCHTMELPLDGLSQSKICSTCGKLKTSWLRVNELEKKPLEEVISKKSEDFPSETEIAKESLMQADESTITLKSVSMKTVESASIKSAAVSESIKSIQSTVVREDVSTLNTPESTSDFEKSFMTARADTVSVKSGTDSMTCHQQCKLHCPKDKDREEQRMVTGSDSLAREVALRDALTQTAAAKESQRSVHIVEPAAAATTETKETKDTKKKTDKKHKEEGPKLPPPKVILSLVDIDMVHGQKKLQEKATQSPSVYTTASQSTGDEDSETVEIEPSTPEELERIETQQLHFIEDLQAAPKRDSGNSQSSTGASITLLKRLSNSMSNYADAK